MLSDHLRFDLRSIADACRSLAGSYLAAAPHADEGPEVVTDRVGDAQLSQAIPVRNVDERVKALDRIAVSLRSAADRLDRLVANGDDELRRFAPPELRAVQSELGTAKRLDSDAVPGFLYQPERVIPPNGLIAMRKRVGRVEAMARARSPEDPPIWLVFDADLTTKMVTHRVETFEAGSRVVTTRQDDDVVHVLDGSGTATVVPKAHPHHFEGADT